MMSRNATIHGLTPSLQGRKDYAEKKTNYFKKRIGSCPNSLRVLNSHDAWTPVELVANQKLVVEIFGKMYGVMD